MKKTIIAGIALGTFALSTGLMTQSANASTAYRTLTTKSYASTTPAYHAKNAAKSVYLWNSTITKKLHNLKNYPKTTWYVQKSVKLTNGKKTGIFYYVQNKHNSANGYVWRGYLSKGKFTSTVTSSTTTNAVPRNYSFDANATDAGPVPYMVKPGVKSGYIWNYSHTKKLYNIKNLASSNWYVNYASVKKYGQKTAVYYRVISNSGHAKGLIWSGYLTRLMAKAPSEFATQSSFDTYMKTARSQRFARQVMKLFPNAKLSLDLSQITQNVDSNNPLKTKKYTDVINIGDLKPAGKTSELTSISAKTGVNMAGKTITPRVKYIESVLNDNGLNSKKRNTMSDYYLGIYIPDDAQVMSDFPKGFNFSSSYPMAKEDHGMNSTVQIFIAKLK